MHVTPRTHCEREGDRALLSPVSILLRAQVKWAHETVPRGSASSACDHTAIPGVRYEGLAKSPIRAFHGERGQPEGCVVLEDGLSRAARTSVEVHGLSAVDAPRGGEHPSDGSRETAPRHGCDEPFDTGSRPTARQMARQVTSERSDRLGRRTLASVSRGTVCWAMACRDHCDGYGTGPCNGLVPRGCHRHGRGGEVDPRRRRTL